MQQLTQPGKLGVRFKMGNKFKEEEDIGKRLILWSDYFTALSTPDWGWRVGMAIR